MICLKEVERIRQINRPLQSEVDKHARIKVEIEEEMMTLLKDQITNDKAAQYLAKMYHEKQHKSRSMVTLIIYLLALDCIIKKH